MHTSLTRRVAALEQRAQTVASVRQEENILPFLDILTPEEMGDLCDLFFHEPYGARPWPEWQVRKPDEYYLKLIYRATHGTDAQTDDLVELARSFTTATGGPWKPGGLPA